MQTRLPVAVVAAALLMALPLSALALPAAPVFPSVTVRVNSVAPVDVNRDSETNISTNGTVNITVPSWVTVETKIYFNVSVNNTYWPALIEPRTATITGSGEVPFTVNVFVPARVGVDANAQIFVDANVSVPPGVGKSFTASTPIPIIQYFGLAITAKTSTSPENFTAQAGRATNFALRLQNLGNGADSFELHVDNLAELQSRGISITLPSPIQVPAKVTGNVQGDVTLPATLTSGNFTISLTAISTGAAAKGETVTAGSAKYVTAAPPDLTGGPGDPNATTPPSGKGFLPGFDLPLTLAAAGVCALMLRRRLIHP